MKALIKALTGRLPDVVVIHPTTPPIVVSGRGSEKCLAQRHATEQQPGKQRRGNRTERSSQVAAESKAAEHHLQADRFGDHHAERQGEASRNGTDNCASSDQAQRDRENSAETFHRQLAFGNEKVVLP